MTMPDFSKYPSRESVHRLIEEATPTTRVLTEIQLNHAESTGPLVLKLSEDKFELIAATNSKQLRSIFGTRDEINAVLERLGFVGYIADEGLDYSRVEGAVMEPFKRLARYVRDEEDEGKKK